MQRFLSVGMFATLLFLACRDPLEPPTVGGIGLVVQVAEDEASVAAVAAVDQALARVVGPAGENSQEVTRTLTIGGTDTLTGFDEGTYVVGLEGYDAGAMTMYGERPGIRVTPGGNTQANVIVASFQPPVTPFGMASTTLFRFTVNFTAVPGASSYEVEVAQDAGFTVGVQQPTVTGTSFDVSVADVGMYYFRVRALTQFGVVGEWGATESVEVIEDGVDVPQALGPLTPGVAQQIPSLNIFPASDFDEFTVDACAEDVLSVTMRAGSLQPQSDLIPRVQVLDALDQLIDEDGGGSDASVQPQLPANGSYTVRAGSDGGNSHGQYELTIEVQAGNQRDAEGCLSADPTQLAFGTEPTSTEAGAVIQPAVTVEARDAQGNVATNFDGDIVVSLSPLAAAVASNIGPDSAVVSETLPPGAVLSGTRTQAAVNGVATFDDLSVDLAGSYALDAADGSGSGLSATTSAAFEVTVGGATGLAFTVQPVNTLQNTPIAPAVEVTAVDDGGNVVPGATGLVTVTLAGGTGGAVLSGTGGRVLTDGVAVFDDLSVDLGGLDYTLEATAPGLSAVSSDPFDIADGSATQLAFVSQPTSRDAGDPFNPAVTVEARDAVGNLVTDFIGDVTIASTGNTATVGGTLTVAAVGGVATFSDLFVETAGTHTLDADSPGLETGTSASFDINAGPPFGMGRVSGNNQAAPPSTLLPAPLVVSVVDFYGNPVSGVTVNWAVTAGTGSLSAASSVTDAAGHASVEYTTGSVAAAEEVQASEAALSGSPVTFTMVSANEVFWSNDLGGSWSNGANWSGGVPPGPGDAAVINAEGTYTVTLDVDATVALLTVGGAASGEQTLFGTGRILTVNGDATVLNAGHLTLTGSSTFTATSLVNQFFTIFEASTVNVNLRNESEVRLQGTTDFTGTVETVTGSTFVIEGPFADVTIHNDFTNTATLDFLPFGGSANLNIVGGVLTNAAGGAIEAEGTGSASLSVGTINTAGSWLVDLPDGMSVSATTLNNTGSLDISGGDLDVNVSGTFRHGGTFTLGAGRSLVVSGNAFVNEVAGFGTGLDGWALDLSTSTVVIERAFTLPGNGTINMNGTTIPGPGQIVNVNGGIALDGTLNLTETTITSGTIVVADTADLDLNGATVNAGVTNDGFVGASGLNSAINGTMENRVSGTLDLQGNTVLSFQTAFDNAGNIALTGGAGELPTLRVETGSDVDDPQPGLPCCLVNMSSGVIHQVGDATGVLDLTPGGVSVQNAGLIESDGVGGITIQTVKPFNTGTIDVNLGTVEFAGTGLFANSGTIRAEGTLRLTIGGFDNNPGATLSGGGTVETTGTPFRNFGEIGPGNSPGRLFIDGDVTLEGSGTVIAEIEGLTPAAEHDQIQVSGTATLGGTLDIRLGAFAPNPGDVFDVLDFGSSTGDFAQVLNTDIDGTNGFFPTVETTTYRLTVGAGGGLATPTPLLFVSTRDGSNTCTPENCRDVFLRSADGVTITNLTNLPDSDDDSPMWSPDGSQIVFSSARSGDREIWVMNADGSNPVNLTNDAGSDFYPSFSPDGTKIAWASDRDFGVLDVWVMDADGMNPVNLTLNSGAADGEPTWSPLGDKIAFLSLRDGDQEIYVMNADGSSPVNVTNDPSEDRFPSWSPVDSRIAFTSDRFGDLDLFTVNSDGLGLAQITTDLEDDFYAAWTPDGTKIIFASARIGGVTQLFETEDNGANQVPLFSSVGADFQPHLQRTPPPPITIAAARAITQPDMPFTVEGVVTWQASWDDRIYFVQDATAGIAVFDAQSIAGTLTEGESVQLVGGPNVFGGETQISPILSVVSFGIVAVPDPRPVTGEEINAGDFQGELATIRGTVDSISVDLQDNQTVYLSEHVADTDFAVFSDSRTGVLPDVWNVGDDVTVIGVLRNRDNTPQPRRLEIRKPEDIIVVPPAAGRVTAWDDHACAIDANLDAWCWGGGFAGQLGDGGFNSAPTPVAVSGGRKFTQIGAGNNFTCALEDGTGAAYCWGWNNFGQLGTGDNADATTPQLVAGGGTFRALAVGRDHACAISAGVDSLAYCWGANDSGQLGDNTQNDANQPVQIGSSTWSAIAAGVDHSCGITGPLPGPAYCWGLNSQGQVGDGTATNPVLVPSAVMTTALYTDITAGSFHTCALQANGQAECWGAASDGQLGDGGTTGGSSNVPVVVTSPGESFASIDGGFDFTCGVGTSGTGYCWGEGGVGETGLGLAGNTNVPSPVAGGLTFHAISAGLGVSCAVEAKGQLFCWGKDRQSQMGNGLNPPYIVPQLVSSAPSFTQISSGNTVTCGLEASGSAWCWGSNLEGNIGDGTASTVAQPSPVLVSDTVDFREIDAWGRNTCAVDTNDLAWCWGANSFGQVGDSTVVSPVTAPVPVVGPGESAPRIAFSTVKTGSFHACGIGMADSLAYCWGRRSFGRLGDGSGADRPYPGPVTGGMKFTGLAVGNANACGINEAGEAFCWGLNRGGILGIGVFSDSVLTPTQVVGGHLFKEIRLANRTACGITTGDELWCWGWNTGDLLGNPSVIDSTASPALVSGGFTWSSVGVSALASCGVTTGGTAKCWGLNWAGSLGNGALGPNESTPVDVNTPVALVLVDPGGTNTCGLTATGATYCWGGDLSGRHGLGAVDFFAVPTQVSAGSNFAPPRGYVSAAAPVLRTPRRR